MTDLEDLLSDTLRGRARTVTEPVAPVVPAVPHRRRWPAVTAAAAAVVLAGVGLAAWPLSRTTGGSPAGADASVACPATLPASWVAAISQAPLEPGVDAVPEGGSADGSLVYSSASGPTSVGRAAVRRPDGQTIVPVLPDRAALRPSWDGRYLVVATAPGGPAGTQDGPVDDIVVADTAAGGPVRHILAGAPVPAGWVVARGDVVVTGGIVYWGAEPAADSANGIVLSYDLAHRRYAVAARTSTSPFVAADPRGGVEWPNGHAGRVVAPSVVPGDERVVGSDPAPVVTDGQVWAWSDNVTGGLRVERTGSDGVVTSWVVDPAPGSRLRPALSATAGPYIFLGLDEAGAETYVLDTRTGAIAPAGDVDYRAVTPGRLFESAGGTGRFHEVDVDRLPELRCR